MPIAHLDPSVQIRIVELAAKWVDDTRSTTPSQAGSGTLIKRRTERFDQAQKEEYSSEFRRLPLRSPYW